jgi:hypothetical protein
MKAFENPVQLSIGTESARAIIVQLQEVKYGRREGSIWRDHEVLERAKEDIYFAERDRDLIEKLKQELKKVEEASSGLRCPKCPGHLETYTFQEFVLERCQSCCGIWMDKGELEGIIRTVTQGPLGHLIDKLLGKEERLGAKT